MDVYFNGKIVKESEMEDILEPGFLFGWGAFETLRVYNKKTAFLDEHLKRLKEGLYFLGLEYPAVDFNKEISFLLNKNKLADAYLRITVFKKRKSVGVIIYVSEFNYYKDEDYKKGFKVIFSPFVRYSRDEFLKVKSISYVNSRVSWFLAQKKEKDEAVFLNERGFIQEGSRSNIFFVKKGVIFTPSLECGLLAGVTRKAIIDICRQIGIKIKEGKFKREELLSSDEIFLTSSLMEVMPVCEIEGNSLDVSKFTLTFKILKKYRQEIQVQR